MSNPSNKPVFRFAPSPNGELHLGHAYSALLNQKLAREFGGKLLLRIEDIDTTRCTRELEQQMLEDLEWIGVSWDEAPRRQSECFEEYRSVIDTLLDRELIYPSTMSRGEIRRLVEDKDWPTDPDGSPHYPGNERTMEAAKRQQILNGDQPFTLRLDIQKAMDLLNSDLVWTEFDTKNTRVMKANPLEWGDVVLARKDTPASYHLCCVLDDAWQNVTHVVRGTDLFQSTSVHRLLQELLGLEAPKYHHHTLLLDKAGKKLSKSDAATSIRSLRNQGITREEIFGLLPKF